MYLLGSCAATRPFWSTIQRWHNCQLRGRRLTIISMHFGLISRGFTWLYMAVDGRIGPYMAVYVCIWLYTAVYSYVALYGCI